MYHPVLQTLLWLVGTGCELSFVALIVRCGLFHRFRFLFVFVCANLVISAVCSVVAVYCSRTVYGFTYWALVLPFQLLIFLFILELFEEAFEAYAGFRKLFQTVLGWTTAGSAAVVFAYISLAGIQADPMQWVNTWGHEMRGVLNLSQALLLLLLLGFVTGFQIS